MAKDRLNPSFAWMNGTQFTGALNDNLFQQFLVLFLIGLYGPEKRGEIIMVAGIVFAVPFLLFMAASGVLADRLSKRHILVGAKVSEIVMMVAGLVGFLSGNPLVLYAALFGMCTQSAFFGPAKLGIIPELVEKHQISKANGFIQAFTYMAIILGTSLAPVVSKIVGKEDSSYLIPGLMCIAVAVAGFFVARRIEVTPSAGSKQKISPLFFREIWHTLRGLRSDRYLLGAVLACGFFLMIAAFFKFYIIPYGETILGLSTEDSLLIFPYTAVGIGIGALLAGKLSGRNIEFGLVPVGAVGLTVFMFALACVPVSTSDRVYAVVCIIMACAGMSVGFFVVPLQAFIQYRSPADKRGQIIAASGFLGWIGVILASVLVGLFEGMKLSPSFGFLLIAGLTGVLAVWALKALPDFFFRFLLLVLTRTCYRLNVKGLDNVPTEGPALLVANHTSWADALVIMATQQRRVRFLMSRRVIESRWWMRTLSGLARVIPIEAKDNAKRIQNSLDAARVALDEGYLVCVFAEGHISRTGMMMGFKAGLERILEGTDHPVIPVYIGGAWGSITSYAHGKPFSRMPLAFPYPMSVLFGEPLPGDCKSFEVRQRVLELSVKHFEEKKPKRLPLELEFVRSARSSWNVPALRDTTGKKLRFGEALAGSLALAKVLERVVGQGGKSMVGVLLPSSVGGALTNLALAFLGKVSVNLNYTASADSIRSALTRCEIHTVITTRPFVEKLEEKVGAIPMPQKVVYLEDLLKDIDGGAKLRAWLRARFLPAKMLSARTSFSADDLATVIFSSGSTSEPKGVMLSHHNILSNVESLRMLVAPGPEDNICAALPFFHSFGYTCTIWLPMLSGFSASYHVNPLEAAKIAELARESHSTILIATPTFLLGYIRRAKPEDFAAMRLVLTGAEKLKSRVAEAFEKRFGILPLEGYGATELSPVAAVNVPNVTVDGVRQIGTLSGSVGQPLPGVAMKIVDPDSHAPLDNDKAGLLLVKGPNVMLGYLGDPGKTAEVIEEGWYNTGDIARMDRNGFVTITDRLSRFSKIAGEMVPHLGVEEALHAVLEKTEQVLAVTSVPDDKKGEKLIVLHSLQPEDAETMHALLAKTDLPNLWKPAKDAYIRIDEIPMLGSGKVDLKKLKDTALKYLGHPSTHD